MLYRKNKYAFITETIKQLTKVLVIDNYDSFTYNLVEQVKVIPGVQVTIRMNDEIGIDDVDHFEYILLSPGPGIPRDAGIMPELIKRYSSEKKILGICLGYQAIAEAFGGRLVNREIYHGVSKPVYFNQTDSLFRGMINPFEAGRYHSWMVEKIGLPDELIVTAWDDNNNIMGIRHRNFDVQGVQFHPESIMTQDGGKILLNWICNNN